MSARVIGFQPDMLRQQQQQQLQQASASPPSSSPSSSQYRNSSSYSHTYDVHRAKSDLAALLRASDSLLPAATGLLPRSVASSPAIAPTVAPFASPRLTTLNLITNALNTQDVWQTAQQQQAAATIAANAMTTEPAQLKQQVTRLISSVTSQRATSSSLSDRNRGGAVWKLGASDEKQEAKEGEPGKGEGEGILAMRKKSSAAALPDSSVNKQAATSTPSDFTLFSSLFPHLQTPSFGVSIYHLSSSVSSSSQLCAYDAKWEDVVKKEVEAYLEKMKPLAEGKEKKEVVQNSLPTSGSDVSNSIASCFSHYTPLSLQTLPILQRYNTVLRKLRKNLHHTLSQAGDAAGAGVHRRSVSHMEEGKEGDEPMEMTTDGNMNDTASTLGTSSSSASLYTPTITYVPPLPSLHQQLSKAITTRVTPVGSTQLTAEGRSFNSLVMHDPQATLQYLTRMLGLQGLGTGAEASSSSSDPSSSSSNETQARLIVPSLLLVNEEIKLRKLNEASTPTSSSSSSTSNSAGHIHYPRAPITALHPTSDVLPYFETLVRLYDQLAPELLMEFISLVEEIVPKPPASSSSSSSSTVSPSKNEQKTTNDKSAANNYIESHIERALRILPPILVLNPTPPRGRILADSTESTTSSSTLRTVGEDFTNTTLPRRHHHSRSGSISSSSSSVSSSAAIHSARLTARCALLVRSGRAIESVLLRLDMLRSAVENSLLSEEEEKKQEELAIQLAWKIVKEEEEKEMRRQSRRRSRNQSRSSIDASLPPTPSAAGVAISSLPASSSSSSTISPLATLRSELFHHFLTYWLQRQFRRYYDHVSKIVNNATAVQKEDGAAVNHHAASESAPPSSVAAFSSVRSFFPPLTSLDPRISSLLHSTSALSLSSPLSMTRETYLEIVAREHTRFEEEMEEKQEEQEREKKRIKKEMEKQQIQQQQQQVNQQPREVWATSSILLPSPALIRSNDSSVPSRIVVDLPMSCLLPELKQFAARSI